MIYHKKSLCLLVSKIVDCFFSVKNFIKTINEGIVLPTFMFPDNDIGTFEFFESTDNINYLNNVSSQLLIYPNPIKDEFNLILPKRSI